jgi:NlpC/P60 family putative phage cell wall peptidase
MNEIIINDAKQWLGTPYKHQASMQNIGCDCIGLVYGVLKQNNLIPSEFNKEELRDYSRISKDFSLITKFRKYFKEIDLDSAKSGDIFVMRFRKYPQHVGFLDFSRSNNDRKEIYIIHSYQAIGKVVSHNLNDKWRSRIMTCFRII